MEERELLTTGSTIQDSFGDDEPDDFQPEQQVSCWPRRAPNDSSWLGGGLLLVSFLAFFKLAEPFLTTYLEQTKHLSSEEIYQSIYPLWTYSQLGWLLVLGVLSEFLTGCKWIVFAGILCFVAEAIMLNESQQLWAFQLVEVVSAGGSAAMTLFSVYCFRMFSVSYYQQVTSWTRAGFLLGTVTSSLLGQLLIDQADLTVATLYWITAGTMLLCAVTVIFFPNDAFLSTKASATVTLKRRLALLLPSWQPIVIPALWLVISLGIHTLTLTFYQVLFSTINSQVNYNGYVEAVSYVLAAGVTSVPGLLHRRFDFKQPVLLTVLLTVAALASCLLLLGLAFVNSLGWAYALFIIYHSVFEFSFTIASAQIAKLLVDWMASDHTRENNLPPISMIFSSNNVLALVFQSLLQLIIGKDVLDLTIRQYFATFAGILGVLALVVLVCGLLAHYRPWARNQARPFG